MRLNYCAYILGVNNFAFHLLISYFSDVDSHGHIVVFIQTSQFLFYSFSQRKRNRTAHTRYHEICDCFCNLVTADIHGTTRYYTVPAYYRDFGFGTSYVYNEMSFSESQSARDCKRRFDYSYVAYSRFVKRFLNVFFLCVTHAHAHARHGFYRRLENCVAGHTS